jgi:electron transfer flavoprotein alpha subunit
MTFTTLVIAEHRRGTVRDVTFELISAVSDLGAAITVAVIAKNPESLAAQVNVDGVAQIITVAAGADEFESDSYHQALKALIDELKPRLTLLGFTPAALDYGPAVAADLGLGFASDVHALAQEGDRLVAARSFYGSKLHAELEFPGKEGVLLLLRPGTWPPAQRPGTASIAARTVATDRSRTRHREFIAPPAASGADVAQADFLLSIGRGVGDEERVEWFRELATKMSATLSVSRPIVDAGWISATQLIGLSGKTVQPKVYLALGISGATQHLAGMRASETIIAVNTDPQAAIFGVAHYGAVTDLVALAEELDKLFST